MRIVAVSVIKNESDIVEAFVRHTAKWADLHLVFDHASTDGSREILAALAGEGIPLRIFTDDVVGNRQQARNNRLVRVAVEAEKADWVIPLDADEFVVATNRQELEAILDRPMHKDRPITLPMGNYFPHPDDPANVSNPAVRLQHRVAIANGDTKIFLPRRIALHPNMSVAKGSHSVSIDGITVAGVPAPTSLWLAHVPQRCVSQQFLRIVTAHLQKLSAGQEHAAVDVHYGSIYRFLARDPELFPRTLETHPELVQKDPIPYLGGELRYTRSTAENWPGVARALLPFLEELALSHGRLTDRIAATAGGGENETFRELPLCFGTHPEDGRRLGEFSGFTSPQGLGPPEGPFPTSLLPRFRWGYAPSTVLDFASPDVRTGHLEWIAQSQLREQTVHIECNGQVLHTFVFRRSHLQERLFLNLPLLKGENRVVLHYENHSASDKDPRKLALSFIRLRIW